MNWNSIKNIGKESGMKTRMSDNYLATMIGLTIWLNILTLMGWSAINPAPPARPYLSYPDKHALLRYSTEQMAADTGRYNDMMERRWLK